MQLFWERNRVGLGGAGGGGGGGGRDLHLFGYIVIKYFL